MDHLVTATILTITMMETMNMLNATFIKSHFFRKHGFFSILISKFSYNSGNKNGSNGENVATIMTVLTTKIFFFYRITF